MEQRLKAGVGCIISRGYISKMHRLPFISERTLNVEIELTKRKTTAIIITYGANKEEIRDE